MGIKISQLPSAGTLKGSEILALVVPGAPNVSRRTTINDIAALIGTSGASSLPVAPVLPYYDKPATTPSAFDDEFNGTTLGSKWSILNATPGNTGRIATVVPDGKVYLDSPYTTNDRVFAIVQSAPTGNFTITAKVGMSSPDYNQYSGPGIFIVGTSANLGLQVVNDNFANPPRLIQGCVTDASSFGALSFASLKSTDMSMTNMYFKVVYDGTNFNFYVSPTGYFSAVNFAGSVAASAVGTISKIGVGMQPYGVATQIWCDFFRVTTP